MAKATIVRPFVAKMEKPIGDESLLGYMDRALQATMIRNVRDAFRMAGVEPDPNSTPNAAKLTDEGVDGIARLFKLDPSEVQARRYPRAHPSTADIVFFGARIRAQYWEPTIRRVSPRALIRRAYHRVMWGFRPFGFDPDTYEPLLDICPVCRKHLGWIVMRGPTKCDHCSDADGYPSTDLRDHPQPTIEVRDEEALRFVVGLVHPDPERRDAALRMIPEGVGSTDRGEVFEAVMYVASCQRADYVLETTDIGRPVHADEFAQITPSMLEAAGRAFIGGEAGFGAVCDQMRSHADKRAGTHGAFKELGPLAAASLDPRLSRTMRDFFDRAIARDFARTHDRFTVRRRLARIPTENRTWFNIDELTKALGVSKHALTRLADGSDIETRRADAVVSPVLMRLDDVRPLAALYKDAVNARAAIALLRVPTPVLRQLAGRELIVRIEGTVARMLGEGDHFRLSSVRGLLLALKERAGKGAAPVGTTRLMDAVRALKPAVPWAAIIAGIAGGEIPVHATKEFGRDWRYAMAVKRDRLLAVVGTHRPGPDEVGGSNPWLTRDAAAQVLGTDETTVWAMGKEGVLPKRAGDFAMFARADVKAAAERYIFRPEMLQRSTFADARQLNAWLRSIGIEPAFVLRGGQISAFPRQAFEAAIPLQPKAPEEDAPPPRERRRVSPADKKRAIEAVTSGLATYYVGKRMGIHHKSIARWVKYFRETGKIEPAGKLDPHAGRIAAMIEANPSRSTNALWADFKGNGGIDVAYTSFARFIAEIGFARDPATDRLERNG